MPPEALSEGWNDPKSLNDSLLEVSEATFPTCTCVSKRGHWRKLRNGEKHWFSDEICGDKAVWEAHNPLTTDIYHVCKAHWTDAAVHTADRMGLKYKKVSDE